jgi:hypothetical protein
MVVFLFRIYMFCVFDMQRKLLKKEKDCTPKLCSFCVTDFTAEVIFTAKVINCSLIVLLFELANQNN